MASRNNDLGSAIGVFHGDHISPDSVANIIIFGRNSLAHWHDRLKFAEIDNDVGTVESSNVAADDFAGAILELVKDHLFLDLPNTLQDRLSGCLRSDSPKPFRCNFDFNYVPDIRLWLNFFRSSQKNLIMHILDMFDDDEVRQSRDLAGSRINGHPKVTGRADAFLSGRQ